MWLKALPITRLHNNKVNHPPLQEFQNTKKRGARFKCLPFLASPHKPMFGGIPTPRFHSVTEGVGRDAVASRVRAEQDAKLS
jgi:hypothetical protein